MTYEEKQKAFVDLCVSHDRCMSLLKELYIRFSDSWPYYLKDEAKELLGYVKEIPITFEVRRSCRYVPACSTRCEQEPMPGTEYCEHHIDKRCSARLGPGIVCNQPATHECSIDHQFVCGRPLCDEHKGKCNCQDRRSSFL